MSFFDDASLVMIPSGYKDQKVYSVKPIDGTGDLTFTRSNDTATRVNSSGLIEKVRTNLVLYSNDFTNATWGKNSCTVTSGQAGYDGTNNAWLLSSTATGGSAYVSQGYTASTIVTRSIYAKAGTSNWVAIFTTGNLRAYFNLSAGTIGTVSAGSSAKIESVGNGYYRCSVSQSTGDSFFVFVANADNDSNTSTGDNVLIQNAQLETGDIATDYIATTSAAVSVGPVANLPRLDYSGGATCPSLLLEPQATALLTFSEAFGNAAYTKLQMNVSENQAISPSGYQDADKIFGVSGEAYILIYSAGLAANTYSVSIFVKAAEYSKFGLRESNSYGSYATFDLTQGTVLDTSSLPDGTVSNAKIEAYSNGWYRCSAVFGGVSSMNWGFIPLPNTYTTGQPFGSYTADGTSGVYIWGYNVTQTNYVQSYIPTLSAAVTRGADSCSKTGISSLIGQTEGTMFAEFTYNGVANSGVYEIIMELGPDANNVITINKNNTTAELYVFAQVAGVIQVNSVGITGTNILGTHKVALAYKLNDYVCYLDGVQVFTDTSATVPTCSGVFVGQTVSSTAQLGGGISQALLFKTRLSNADLATLTA